VQIARELEAIDTTVNMTLLSALALCLHGMTSRLHTRLQF